MQLISSLLFLEGRRIANFVHEHSFSVIFILRCLEIYPLTYKFTLILEEAILPQRFIYSGVFLARLIPVFIHFFPFSISKHKCRNKISVILKGVAIELEKWMGLKTKKFI